MFVLFHCFPLSWAKTFKSCYFDLFLPSFEPITHCLIPMHENLCGVGTYQEVIDFIQLLQPREDPIWQVTDCFIQHEYFSGSWWDVNTKRRLKRIIECRGIWGTLHTEKGRMVKQSQEYLRGMGNGEWAISLFSTKKGNQQTLFKRSHWVKNRYRSHFSLLLPCQHFPRDFISSRYWEEQMNMEKQHTSGCTTPLLLFCKDSFLIGIIRHSVSIANNRCKQ